MKTVFICSPFGGDKKNQERAKEYCKFALSRGYAPFAPHLFFPIFLDDEKQGEREIGITCGLSFLVSCDAIWVFTEENEALTSGMKREITLASERGRSIEFMYDKYIEWKEWRKKNPTRIRRFD